MDKNQVNEPEPPIETRIGEMKKQFQKSYDIFMRAHDELTKLNFEHLTVHRENRELNEAISKLNTSDVNEILGTTSIDDSIQILRSKINSDEEKIKSTFPDITKLLKIMNNLQIDIESLREQQDKFVKLTNDVHEEMNRFEKEIEEASNQLDDLTVESVDSSGSSSNEEEEDDVSHDDDEEYEEFRKGKRNNEEEEAFDSECFSD
ncbi:hypothetical protein PVAND_001187 [Polypedilum vanderplanki]|uniref:Uncharacterized protein n=1 Tax=Polypedilum vanderplanki TaxID=319348 RepID=A0A9J6BNF8_POLVA|nr:hypothetical protein PVAND_001187 [Polypedilum vanderplanki]